MRRSALPRLLLRPPDRRRSTARAPSGRSDPRAGLGRQQITINARDDRDVRTREVVRRHDGTRWGVAAPRQHLRTRNANHLDPARRHWKIFVRIEEVSGLTEPQPTADTAPTASSSSTAPHQACRSPARSRMNPRRPALHDQLDRQRPNLHSTPITLRCWVATSGPPSPRTFQTLAPLSGPPLPT